MKDEAAVMPDAMTDFWPWDELESGEELLYLRAGQKLDTLRKLRRGEWVIQGELDLHGLNTDEARSAVAGFFIAGAAKQQTLRAHHSCKGLGSKKIASRY